MTTRDSELSLRRKLLAAAGIGRLPSPRYSLVAHCPFFFDRRHKEAVDFPHTSVCQYHQTVRTLMEIRTDQATRFEAVMALTCRSHILQSLLARPQSSGYSL